MQAQVLRLFKGIQVDGYGDFEHNLEAQVRNGFLMDSRIDPKHFNLVKQVYGFDGQQANSTFHKSWVKVRDADMEQLVIEQLVHYLTTYGFESLGIFDGTVYIPTEQLELEGLGTLPLTYIRALSRDEVLEEILKLADSGIALSQSVLDDLMVIISANQYSSFTVKNRELQIRLYDHFGTVPQEPEEWLRYVIYKTTGETLVIKNRELIEKMRQCNFDSYLEKAPDNLGEIFLRYKPLFLAMRNSRFAKTYINRVRKQAKHQHRPLGVDYLNDVTRQITYGELNLDVLRQRLQSATIFRKIRLAYALRKRLEVLDTNVYTIRNGKTWVDETYQWFDTDDARQILEIVLDSIADDMGDKLEGQTFYIPERVYYTLPATEKQFIGNFPNGTFIGVQDDLIVGVNWFNTSRRIDIDYSMVSDTGKYGWNASWRDNQVLFSGDMTDASGENGATELFYIQDNDLNPNLLYVNYFNCDTDDPVRCKLLVANESPKNFNRNYMVDPANIVAMTEVTIDKPQLILGLVADNGVYFSKQDVKGGIVSNRSDRSEKLRQYMIQTIRNGLTLNYLIERAGGIVVNEMVEGAVDLSPQALDKTTILNLLI